MLVDMAGSENIEAAGQTGFEAKMQVSDAGLVLLQNLCVPTALQTLVFMQEVSVSHFI